MSEEKKYEFPRMLVYQGQARTSNVLKAARKRAGVKGKKASHKFYQANAGRFRFDRKGNIHEIAIIGEVAV